MEKKKILLVAVSVGIFLVVAIGAAILMFSSRNGVSSNAVVMERSNQDAYQPIPSVEGIPAYPRVTDEAADSPYSFPQFPSGETERQSYPQERTETGNSGTTPAPVIINIPRPESVRPLIPSETPSAAQGETRTALSPAKPAVKQPSPAKPAAAPARETYDAYWVQAGSFSSRTYADSAKDMLTSRGITSIIENRELDGKTFYRVRIGPYISQNEANYWLALIQTLDGFGESLIWKNQVQRLN